MFANVTCINHLRNIMYRTVEHKHTDWMKLEGAYSQDPSLKSCMLPQNILNEGM